MGFGSVEHEEDGGDVEDVGEVECSGVGTMDSRSSELIAVNVSVAPTRGSKSQHENMKTLHNELTIVVERLYRCPGEDEMRC